MVHLKHVDIQRVPLIMSLSERKYNLTLLMGIYVDFPHLTGSEACDGHFQCVTSHAKQMDIVCVRNIMC